MAQCVLVATNADYLVYDSFGNFYSLPQGIAVTINDTSSNVKANTNNGAALVQSGAIAVVSG